jgi:hypothetical protein
MTAVARQPVGEDEAPGELTCGPGVCGWLTQADVTW